MYINLLKFLFLLEVATKCLGEVNYELRVESFEGIEGEDETLFDYRQLKLIKRERLANGSIYHYADLNDDFKVFFETFTLKNGEWTPMPYAAHGISPCEYYTKFFIPYFDPASQNTNFPTTAEDYCPLRKMEYWIINMAPKTDKWVTFVRRGVVKLHFDVRKNEKVVGGFEIVGNIADRTF